MRRLQSDLNKAASELTAREVEWEKQRTSHRDSCGSLARWYREKQRTLESGRWEMSLTTRLSEQATRHDTSAAQWEGALSVCVCVRLRLRLSVLCSLDGPMVCEQVRRLSWFGGSS